LLLRALLLVLPLWEKSEKRRSNAVEEEEEEKKKKQKKKFGHQNKMTRWLKNSHF